MRLFGPNTKEVTRKWKRLHDKELNDFLLHSHFCSGDQIEMNVLGGTSGRYGGEKRDIYNILLEKPEGK